MDNFKISQYSSMDVEILQLNSETKFDSPRQQKCLTPSKVLIDIPITYITEENDPENSNIPRQEIQNGGMNSSLQYLSTDAQIIILRAINDFYKSGLLPSYNDVYESVKDLFPTILSLAQFENNMTVLGYTYKKMPFGHILMEYPEITFERFFYLKTIIEMRKKNKQNIYYIDKRIIDTSLSFQKTTLYSSNASLRSKFDTSVFLYIISAETGKVTGVFTNILDSSNFSKWIADVVLDILNPYSLVVVDNNFKQTISRKEITMYDTKDDILKWLKGNSVPCTNNMRKAELFELYKKTPKKDTNCNFSSILESHGHCVLHLPTTLSDLSPTNFLWEEIRRILSFEDPEMFALTNNQGMNNLISKISALVMPDPFSNFSEFNEIVESKEEELFALDAEIENSLDNLIKKTIENTIENEQYCFVVKSESCDI